MRIAILSVLVAVFSLTNLLRIAVYMLGADYHDIKRHRSVKNRQSSRYRPLISVVVPAHNEEAVIERCLASIYANPYPRKEVLVVDDGSADSTRARAAEFRRRTGAAGLRLFSKPNGGKASAINLGINLAQGQLVMVLDADSGLYPDAIAEAVSYFRDRRVVLTAANVKIIPQKGVLGLVQRVEYLLAYRMKRAQTAYNVEYIVGGIGSTFRRSVALRVGGFDTDTVTEDIDFTMKILSRGNVKQRVMYAPSVIAYTESVLTFRELISQRYRWAYGRFQTFLKNKHMFFSRDRRYDRRLTWIQLPYALYSETNFLLEPLVLGFLLYILIRYTDLRTLLTAYLVTTCYLALNIIAEDTESVHERAKLLLLVPLQYPLFFIMSAVEYAALIKSILNWRNLLRRQGDNRWQHVERSGSGAMAVANVQK